MRLFAQEVLPRLHSLDAKLGPELDGSQPVE